VGKLHLTLMLIALLAGCGGGEEEKASDRPANAICIWDPREQPVVYVCGPGTEIKGERQ
jgi:hypothetical protein